MLVIGAGLAGIAAAHRLVLAGVDDVVVLERAAELGGSWRDNVYPGCTCDIPSNLYSYSFAPNPQWTSSFARQAEILAYLNDCAARFGLVERIRFGTELTRAEWAADRRRWLVDTTTGRYTAAAVVVATGPFAQPSVPDLPGLGDFGGTVLHSARWSPATDLTARRVAVVGTGASAVQIVPAIAETARELQVYQRTPTWVLPKNVRATSALTRAVYRRFPAVQRAVRGVQYWSRELPAHAIANRPALLSAVERKGHAHLRAAVADERLRAALTPNHRIFCKRVLVSDDYYPTLTRPHVELVTDPIERVGPGEIVTGDGTARGVDVIVMATGFAVTEPPIAERLHAGGTSLARTWRQHGRAAYLGTCVTGFPNLFLCSGPNAGTGHTSLLVMIEAQVDYIVSALRTMAARHLSVVEVTAGSQHSFTDEMRRAMTRSVWLTGGCSSYYLDATGHNTTLWPGSTRSFRRRTRHFDIESYRVEPTQDPTSTGTQTDVLENA
ncbi:flavin-containing monooxygenase [Actinophytocola sp.]|uniref:flavin-containing monooxygenase n=1 Tax=Actinophytocola sp. TaxID=1872138 RepID=UPI00389AE669